MNISRLNFPQTLPFIKQIILNSHYISLDLQMSGITDRLNNPSLVDPIDQRYQKLKFRVYKFIPLQLGICCHHVDPLLNKVTLYPFNFYIYPITLNDERSEQFLFNASSLNYLAENNFDFNRLFYEYVPYVNKTEKEKAIKNNQGKNFTKELARLEMLYSPYTKAFFQLNMPIIEEWLKNINSVQHTKLTEKQILYLKTLKIDIKFVKYKTYTFLIEQIKKKYPSMTLSFEFDSKAIYERKFLIIIKDKQDSLQYNKNKSQNLTGNNTIFTNNELFINQVVQIISKKRIPIIVHNGLLDLMHIHHRFFQNLPPTRKQFVSNLRNIFPYVYDTKFICQSNPVIANSLDNRETNLGACYDFFRKKEKSINICIDQRFEEYKFDDDSSHQAGFDAMMTGYVFVSSMNHLKKPLASIIQPQFHKNLSLMRNRIPLGNIRVPLNLEQTGQDFYSKDGSKILIFRSIMGIFLSQIQITNLLKQYGSFTFLWKDQQINEFYIIFLDLKDYQNFQKTFLDKQCIGIAKFEDYKFLVTPATKQIFEENGNLTQNKNKVQI